MYFGKLVRIARRVGHRGGYLLFIALLDILFALSLASPPPEVRGSPAFRYIATVLPLPIWAAIWLAVGIICLIQTFTRSDRLAFGLASGLKLLWGSVYLGGWLLAGVARGWVGAAIWISFGALTTLISTWPEVPSGLGQLKTYEDVSRHSPDAIITADRNGVITSWNTAAELLLGWSAKEIVGHPVTIIVPHRLRARHQAGLGRVRRTGKMTLAGRLLEMTALHRDGTLIPVEITLGVWESKTGIAFTAVVRDARTPSITFGGDRP